MKNETKKILVSLVVAVIGLPLSAIHAQDESIQITAPLTPVKNTAKPQQQAASANGGSSAKEQSGPQLPVRFSMSIAEVVESVGPPVGEVAFGGKVTYYYENGEVEFVEGVVDRFKWDGKFYTHRRMPKLARANAGALSIRAGGGSRPAVDNSNTKVTQGGAASTAGQGKITTNDGRSATNEKRRRPLHPVSQPVLDTKEKVKQIGLDRREAIRKAGLEDLLLSE